VIQDDGLYVYNMYNIVEKHFIQYCYYTYIHTYHSHFIPEGVAEASQIFFRDAHVLLKLMLLF
jgi:hypothetical protein